MSVVSTFLSKLKTTTLDLIEVKHTEYSALHYNTINRIDKQLIWIVQMKKWIENKNSKIK